MLTMQINRDLIFREYKYERILISFYEQRLDLNKLTEHRILLNGGMSDCF